MLRMHVLKAVFLRNVQSYFSSAIGYLIIVVFVVAGAFLAFNPMFFTNNLANLDQLSQYFPMLLLFLIPAITMSVWSEEKKLGTEELLFTLPASDMEILLGKYAASLAVYTAAVLFSFSHFIVLLLIGEPDVPLTLATYFGYWLAGAALISAGMLASVLTNSATVAFVLGATFCAIPVFIGRLAPGNEILQTLSLPSQLNEFTIGLIPLSGVLYFVSLTVLFLYLNFILISRRHWSNSAREHMGGHYLIRGGAIAVLLFSLLYANNVAGLFSVEVDATSEQIYSLSPTTRDIVSRIEEDRPVTIQAFISKEVPRTFVDLRTRLIGLLNQFDKLGGSRVDVRIVDVEVYSDAAEEAEIYGIEPTSVLSEDEGRQQVVQLYLGVVFTSSYDEVIIPLIGPGTPIEYELTRSLQTVSNSKRLTVGVLNTEANVMSGQNNWEIIDELKKQYNVKAISPTSEIIFNESTSSKTEADASDDEAAESEDTSETSSDEADSEEGIDVLLAVLPSSLPADQLQHLVDYVEAGHPAVILDDPLPYAFSQSFMTLDGSRITFLENTPRKPAFPPEESDDGQPKEGETKPLLDALGLNWEYDQVVWNIFNPHPQFESVPPEYLFITPKNGNPQAISSESDITSGLQEIIAFFAGTITPQPDSDLTYTPLLGTGDNSGILKWSDFTTPDFNPANRSPATRLKQNRTYVGQSTSSTAEDAGDVEGQQLEANSDHHVIACHVTGDQRDVVYIADVDMLSDFFFQQRRADNLNFRLDNVTFILNAIDKVAGVEDFISLRKRRAKHRTLSYVEQVTSDFKEQLTREREKATKAADQKLADLEKIFEERRKAIEENTEMSGSLKRSRLDELEETKARREVVDQAEIEQEKNNRIEKARAKSQQFVRKEENKIRYWAIFLSPLPALILGVIVVSMRLSSEQRSIATDRRVR